MTLINSHYNIKRCPVCNGKLKWSNIQDNIMICRNCNIVIDKSEIYG